MTQVARVSSWRDCEFVSLTDAARIVGRDTSWTQRALCRGDLEAVRLPCGGREVVTVRSLARFVDRSEPTSGSRRVVSGPALRLVVDNR